MKKYFIICFLATFLFLAGCSKEVTKVKDNFLIVKDVASDNEKSQWLTYTDSVAKYSFKYPQGLTISPISDRAVYFYYKRTSASERVTFQIFYPEEFDNKKVIITDQQSFTKKVNRRMTGLFKKGDKVFSHETSFMGEPAIVVENGSYATNMSGEIFVWHGNLILVIEIPSINADQVLLSKIFSTFTSIK